MTTLIRPEGPEPDDIRFSRRALATGTIGGLFFAGYAPAALAAQAAPIQTGDDGLTIEQTTVPAPDGFDLPIYVARPTGDGPHPVIIVVSEIFGVHEYIRDCCRRLAHQGYAAIAPAFFVRVEDPAPLSDMQRIQEIVGAASYEQVMGDISATLEWTSQQLWAKADKVGVTGWCWGGKVVWQACARFAVIDAGVAWYGRLAPAPTATPQQAAAGQPWPVDLADDLKCPVLGLYGENDRGIPLESVEAMRSALAAAGQTSSEIIVFPGAPHGFHADYRDSFRPEAAAEGWSKLLAFFGERLK
ncbi:dienelactone hydrolase family protein [Brevundimonas lenta]|uniref:Carboxymethylenebutenolidase n=1 Tax=Brevundimonas lenta TaxID=424796 RepID=A0A7W6J9X9_9CAUL|nr:dienelactone hydrolase family protein [Brevundimonas lenta]MBB4081233.1 carboxymethylenebutenolidase [Brevundimonas lenta]